MLLYRIPWEDEEEKIEGEWREGVKLAALTIDRSPTDSTRVSRLAGLRLSVQAI